MEENGVNYWQCKLCRPQRERASQSLKFRLTLSSIAVIPERRKIFP